MCNKKQVIKIDENTVEVDGVRYERTTPDFKDLEPGTKIRLDRGTLALVIKDSNLTEECCDSGLGLLLLEWPSGKPWMCVARDSLRQAVAGLFTVVGAHDE